VRAFALAFALTLGSSAAWAAGLPADPEGGKRGAVLTGTVRDGHGAPVASVTVHLEEAFRHEADAVTDPRGHYRFDGIEPGQYNLRMEQGELWTRVQHVKIGAGTQSRDLTFARHELRGRVVSPAGAPVAGARVEFSTGDHKSIIRSTNADGGFTVPVLEEWYRLSARAPGFAEGELDLPLRIRGDPWTPLEIRLQPAPAILSGRVTGLSPEELAAVVVESGSVRSGIDASGRYRLAGRIWDSSRIEASVGETKHLTIELPPGGGGERTVNIAFPEYFRVSGRVLNPDGTPTQFDGLVFDDPGQFDRLAADIGAEGRFSALLPNGRYQMQAFIEGEHFSMELVPISLAGEPLVVSGAPRDQVEVRLDAEGTISGRLVGVPAAGFNGLIVKATQGRFTQWGKVDKEGRYRISWLTAGKWEVAAYSGPDGSGAEEAAGTVILPTKDSQATLNLVFEPGTRTLTGRITGFDPSARLIVLISRLDVPFHAVRIVDVDGKGRFRCSGLGARPYQVEVQVEETFFSLYFGNVDLATTGDVVVNLHVLP
jgi:hypothetical protein